MGDHDCSECRRFVAQASSKGRSTAGRAWTPLSCDRLNLNALGCSSTFAKGIPCVYWEIAALHFQIPFGRGCGCAPGALPSVLGSHISRNSLYQRSVPNISTARLLCHRNISAVAKRCRRFAGGTAAITQRAVVDLRSWDQRQTATSRRRPQKPID